MEANLTTKISVASNKEIDTRCPICYTEYKDLVQILLDCGHIFCYQCLEKAYKMSYAKCSLCMKPLSKSIINLLRKDVEYSINIDNSVNKEQYDAVIPQSTNITTQINRRRRQLIIKILISFLVFAIILTISGYLIYYACNGSCFS